MWVLLVLGIGSVAIYEFAQSQAARCCNSSSGPTTCGICYTPGCGCDGTGGCCMNGITSDPATWPSGDKVWDVCRAIALAEGANESGSAPDRYNNPGDLSKGDEHGQPIVGYINLPDGETLIQFATKTGGWQALYTKINNIRLGISLTFRPSYTWSQIAAKYAGNSAAWVTNVTDALNVSPSDQFGSYFA